MLCGQVTKLPLCMCLFIELLHVVCGPLHCFLPMCKAKVDFDQATCCFTQLKAFDSGLEMAIFMNSITGCDDFCQPNDMHAHQHVWFQCKKSANIKPFSLY